MRVYEIAKAAGVPTKQARETMIALGLPVLSPSSSVREPVLAEALISHLTVVKTLVGKGATSTYRMTDGAGNFLGYSGKP